MKYTIEIPDGEFCNDCPCLSEDFEWYMADCRICGGGLKRGGESGEFWVKSSNCPTLSEKNDNQKAVLAKLAGSFLSGDTINNVDVHINIVRIQADGKFYWIKAEQLKTLLVKFDYITVVDSNMRKILLPVKEE